MFGTRIRVLRAAAEMCISTAGTYPRAAPSNRLNRVKTAKSELPDCWKLYPTSAEKPAAQEQDLVQQTPPQGTRQGQLRDGSWLLLWKQAMGSKVITGLSQQKILTLSRIR